MRDARDQAGEDEEQQREDGGLAWFWVAVRFGGFWGVFFVGFSVFFRGFLVFFSWGFCVFVFISVFVLGGWSISCFFRGFFVFFVFFPVLFLIIFFL